MPSCQQTLRDVCIEEHRIFDFQSIGAKGTKGIERNSVKICLLTL